MEGLAWASLISSIPRPISTPSWQCGPCMIIMNQAYQSTGQWAGSSSIAAYCNNARRKLAKEQDGTVEDPSAALLRAISDTPKSIQTEQ